MKKLLLLFYLPIFCFGQQHTITTTGSSEFSPDIVHCLLGESIEFQLGTSHNAVEVSHNDWDNDIGSNPIPGGLSIGLGQTVVFTPTTPDDTIWYVCQPHVTMGMKGMIIVFPNSTTINEFSPNKKLLKVTDILGREVKGIKNEPLFYIYNNGRVEKKVIVE